MSAGAFEVSRYVRNDGEIHPIRIQPETAALVIDGTTNAASTSAVTRQTLAKISKSNSAYGVRPRKINVRFTSTLPTGYKADQTYAIPALQEAIWDAALPSTTGTYLGSDVVVVSRQAENVR